MATEEAERRMLAWCILHCTAGLCIILILVYNFYRIATLSEKINRHWMLFVLDIIAILCFLMHTAFDATTNILFYTNSISLTDEWCVDYTYLRGAAYEMGKFSLYAVWITQIHISYKESAYKYSLKRVIIPLYILDVVFIVLFLCVLNPPISDSTTDGYECRMKYNIFKFGIIALFDIFFSVTTLVLFIRPLTLLIGTWRSRGDSGGSTVYRLIHVLIKKTILIVLTIVSSNVLLFCEFAGVPLVPVDDVVNTVCILMMLSMHQDIYTKCCGEMERQVLKYTVDRKGLFDSIYIHFTPLPDFDFTCSFYIRYTATHTSTVSMSV